MCEKGIIGVFFRSLGFISFSILVFFLECFIAFILLGFFCVGVLGIYGRVGEKIVFFFGVGRV